MTVAASTIPHIWFWVVIGGVISTLAGCNKPTPTDALLNGGESDVRNRVVFNLADSTGDWRIHRSDADGSNRQPS